MLKRTGVVFVAAGCLALLFVAGSCAKSAPVESTTDLASQPTLFVVGYAHLDTQWRWDYPTTIREYLPKTIRTNFQLIEKYPHYVFNFSGARRYQMIQEYYPEDFARLKRYVAAGRWFPAGSSVEENDVNSPSAESIIRQILYGKQYFTKEFGKTSAEYMLPDCFGFPASLPSILAHTGLKAFSSQKLSSAWQPAAKVGGPDSPEQTPVGIPFNVGIWEGPDGKTVIAALNPGSYGGSVTYDLSTAPPPPPPPANPQQRPRPLVDWPSRIALNGRVTGVFADFMYYGTGDTGGSPNEASVKMMEHIVTKTPTPIPPFPQTAAGGRGRADQAASLPSTPPEPPKPVPVGNGPVKVVSATAEQLFVNLTEEQQARLPRYKGDLELINHSAGSLTSQAYMKRWNRQNEVLADNAERASVLADWLGGRLYPLQRLNAAWSLVLGNQMHDIIPGTSIPKAYEYSWNDEVLAMNQFAGVLTSATEAVGAALDTRASGTPVIVFNALNIEREDLVEAEVPFEGGAPPGVRVVGPDGAAVPAQVNPDGRVLFLARVPPVGYAVFDVQPSKDAAATPLGPVTETSLENHRYQVQIDKNGDIASLFDKSLGRELLASPARLEIKTDNPSAWPAWNMDFEDQMRAPRAFVQAPARVRIVENGPARIALEIAREAEGSTFVQTIRLAAGDAGNRVEVANAIDWMTKEAHLKAVFPLSASNRLATYNWDIGTIDRTTNEERQFEVASHQWVDLTDQSGAFGVTLLTDCKNGSDKPADNTLRLTLVRTPGTRGGYEDQGTQDWGRHEFVYGLAAHAGGWRDAGSQWHGYRLNQPLVAFTSTRHAGSLGKRASLLSLDNPRIRVLAVKKAEQSDEIIVRMVEMAGNSTDDVRATFVAPVVAAREVNGAEEPVGPATIASGALVASFTPYQPRTFAVRLEPPATRATPPASRPVPLACDQAVASPDGVVSAGHFDTAGRSLPAELLPPEVSYGSVSFNLVKPEATRPNAMVARGQTLQLPEGRFTRVHILAAASEGDQVGRFFVGEEPFDLRIQNWGGYIGQWDNRRWEPRVEEVTPRPGQPAPPPGTPPRTRTVMAYAGLTPGFVKTAPVAWFASHRHASDGTNEPYAYSYLCAYTIDLPENARTVTLPVNERIRVLAVSVTDDTEKVAPAHPLYDLLIRPAAERRP
ncbi:MAG: alpha-mannosidase [Vicinamibacterales bacterium]